MKTFIARYIPGNIFHFVGRQFLGAKLGISQATLALSSVLESFLLLVVGCFFILTGFFNNFFDFSIFDRLDGNVKKHLLMLVGGCFIILIFFIYNKHLSDIFRVFSIKKTGSLIRLLIYYSIFLMISGVILFCIFSFMFTNNLEIGNLPVIVCANVFAWMGGFVTPGAPGGLGVREALLMILLSDTLPAAIILGGAIVFRIVTIFGEVLTLCLSIYLFRGQFEKVRQS
jgi:uncharacterized membrane protein YbhN (UPF0104 family)